MKCPFELPVKKQSYTDVLECEWYEILDVNCITIISQLTKPQADYIVQAIIGGRMKTKSQKERVRDRLINGFPITQMQALRCYRSMRLGALIYALRKEGYDIKTEMIKVRDRTWVARYSI